MLALKNPHEDMNIKNLLYFNQKISPFIVTLLKGDISFAIQKNFKIFTMIIPDILPILSNFFIPTLSKFIQTYLYDEQLLSKLFEMIIKVNWNISLILNPKVMIHYQELSGKTIVCDDQNSSDVVVKSPHIKTGKWFTYQDILDENIKLKVFIHQYIPFELNDTFQCLYNKLDNILISNTNINKLEIQSLPICIRFEKPETFWQDLTDATYGDLCIFNLLFKTLWINILKHPKVHKLKFKKIGTHLPDRRWFYKLMDFDFHDLVAKFLLPFHFKYRIKPIDIKDHIILFLKKFLIPISSIFLLGGLIPTRDAVGYGLLIDALKNKSTDIQKIRYLISGKNDQNRAHFINFAPDFMQFESYFDKKEWLCMIDMRKNSDIYRYRESDLPNSNGHCNSNPSRWALDFYK